MLVLLILVLLLRFLFESNDGKCNIILIRISVRRFLERWFIRDTVFLSYLLGILVSNMNASILLLTSCELCPDQLCFHTKCY